MRKPIYAILLTTLCFGCTNAYKEYYQSFVPAGVDVKSIPGYNKDITEVQVFASNDMRRDVDDWITKGYVPIGESAFRGAERYITLEDAKTQAKAVGAHVVLMSSQYSHTNNGAVPIYVPNSSTSHTTGSATVSGPYGSATGYGTATTTTSGGTTMMMPYSVNVFSSSAVYLVQRKPRLGIYADAPSDDFRKKLGSNQGVVARIVVEGSPAFRAGIMRGDVIMSIGPHPIYVDPDIGVALDKLGVGSTTIEVIRDDKRLKKTVVIAP